MLKGNYHWQRNSIILVNKISEVSFSTRLVFITIT